MSQTLHSQIVIIGGGPAGLMAAEAAVNQGLTVDLFDAMPSVGRKFLLAGKGGLNLTHAEPLERFIGRYREQASRLEPLLHDFGPLAIRQWAQDLGIETFVGTSQRVFPTAMKAAPLLRAWIRRLKEQGVRFHPRHRWLGWTPEGHLTLSSPQGPFLVVAEATILALGGGSWPHLGSDGQWVECLRQKGVVVNPLEASNSGFTRLWSETFSHRFAGIPVKTVEVTIEGDPDTPPTRGELMITSRGLEGGLIYALSSALRAQVNRRGYVDLIIDLTPDRALERLQRDLTLKRGQSSLSTHLRKNAGLSDVKIGLLREGLPQLDPERLAVSIKALPIRLGAPFPLAEAISSSGGVALEGLNENMMVSSQPGLFIAGEMLDWDAPTGGYLLTASLATGRKAGLAAAQWVQQHAHVRV